MLLVGAAIWELAIGYQWAFRMRRSPVYESNGLVLVVIASVSLVCSTGLSLGLLSSRFSAANSPRKASVTLLCLTLMAIATTGLLLWQLSSAQH